MGQDKPKDRNSENYAVRVIEARCVSCHGAELVEKFSLRVLAEGGASLLDARLKEHRAPDAEARAAIVEYFSSLAIRTDP